MIPMHDVIVCCFHRGDSEEISSFPAVRAACLAKYLRRIGVEAEFRTLPSPGMRCRTLVVSEYQPDEEYLAAMMPTLLEIRAEQYFYITNTGISDSLPQRCTPTRWFADRGGLLVHLSSSFLGPKENYIGLGVDFESVYYDEAANRDGILFDFPGYTWTTFNAGAFQMVRRNLAGCRILAAGPPDATIKAEFDEWWDYGRSHKNFIKMYRGCAAFVPGWPESMGMAVAEAQLSGSAVIGRFGWVKREMLCSAAKINYSGDALCLSEAIQYALETNPEHIAAEARSLFDPVKMAMRVAVALGLRAS
jgi:hypothetical protein